MTWHPQNSPNIRDTYKCRGILGMASPTSRLNISCLVKLPIHILTGFLRSFHSTEISSW